MAKRKIEPVEALGPQVDGLENLIFPPVPQPEEAEPLEELVEEPVVEEPLIEHPVVLLCGDGAVLESVASLARDCGFAIEAAVRDEAEAVSYPLAEKTHVVPDFEDFVNICGVERGYFICLFLENVEECEDILYQCLSSDAHYLGVYGDMEKKEKIFSDLRGAGAPDAELAAVACPMGLNVGAMTPQQEAVAIVAELLAARAGTLKRLRHEETKQRPRRTE